MLRATGWRGAGIGRHGRHLWKHLNCAFGDLRNGSHRRLPGVNGSRHHRRQEAESLVVYSTFWRIIDDYHVEGLNLRDFVLSTGHDLIDQLRAYRLKVGLAQADIAWKLGFSTATVSRWERGAAEPDLRATGAIVDFLRRADAQTERRLLASILASGESRNLWEGRDIRYLGGSQQEYRESPEMRAVVGTSIRRFLTGHYRTCIEDQALVAGLYAREVASIEIYGGPALSVTSIPEGYVQMKRLSFQSEMRGIIRGDTHSILIPEKQAQTASAVIVHSWDTLSRRP